MWKQELWHTKVFPWTWRIPSHPSHTWKCKTLSGVNSQTLPINCTALIAGETKITQGSRFTQLLKNSPASPEHLPPRWIFWWENYFITETEQKRSQSCFLPPYYCSLDSSHSSRNTQRALEVSESFHGRNSLGQGRSSEMQGKSHNPAYNTPMFAQAVKGLTANSPLIQLLCLSL